jgi:hypothetical protein
MKYLLTLIMFVSLSTLAQIGPGLPIKAVDVQEIKDKAEYKRKCVTKVLGSDVSFNNLSNQITSNNRNDYLSDLRIENLQPNSRYEANIHAYFLSVASTQHELDFLSASADNNDQTFHGKLRLYNSGTDINHLEAGKIIEFTTGSTETTARLRFGINSGTSGSLISSSTRLTVCEADDKEDIANF